MANHPRLSDEELILSFYGWKPPTSPDVIARAFINPRENLHILAKFRAPDDITREPAYFIVSKTFYRGKTYGYINVSKITSVGSGTYTVTFDEAELSGTSAANIDERELARSPGLISAKGKATSQAVWPCRELIHSGSSTSPKCTSDFNLIRNDKRICERRSIFDDRNAKPHMAMPAAAARR